MTRRVKLARAPGWSVRVRGQTKEFNLIMIGPKSNIVCTFQSFSLIDQLTMVLILARPPESWQKGKNALRILNLLVPNFQNLFSDSDVAVQLQNVVPSLILKYYGGDRSSFECSHTVAQRSLTVKCAALIPPDGILAEQVGSSPSASHCFVVAEEAGSGVWKNSTPVIRSFISLFSFILSPKTTVMPITQRRGDDGGHSAVMPINAICTKYT